MTPVMIGPLAFAPDRLAAIVAALLLVGLAGALARWRGRPALPRWAWIALAVFVVTARAMHVVTHAASFAAAPWTALALWQGGFAVKEGVIAVLVWTLIAHRRDRAALGAAAMALAGAAAGALAILAATGGVVRSPLPATAYSMLDGGRVVPADLRGQVVVMNFWATWCPPCRREMPMLAGLASERTDAAFLFVNQGESAERIRRYLDAEGLDLPVVLDPLQSLGGHYGAFGLPVTLVIGRDGLPARLQIGEISRATLTGYLDAVMAEK